MSNNSRVITFAVAFSLATSAAAFAQGPIGWWKLDDTRGTVAVDASGNGNTGVNAPAGVDINVPGAVSGAFRFLNGEVRVPHTPLLSPAGNTFTVSAWVNPSGFSCNGFGQCAVVANEGQPGQVNVDGYGLRIIDGGHTFQFCFGAEATSGVCTYGSYIFPTGVWTHIAGTYDGVTFREYVNGVEIASLVQPMPPLDTDQDLVIGGLPSGNLRFEGSIDDVRVYGRTLAGAEVMDLATVNPAGAQGETGPQGPQGPVGPQGEGLMSGSLLMLPGGTAAPAGYVFVGSFDLQPSGANRGRGTQMSVDVYRKQ